MNENNNQGLFISMVLNLKIPIHFISSATSSSSFFFTSNNPDKIHMHISIERTEFTPSNCMYPFVLPFFPNILFQLRYQCIS